MSKMLKNGRSYKDISVSRECSCCVPRRGRRAMKHQMKRKEAKAWRREVMETLNSAPAGRADDA